MLTLLVICLGVMAFLGFGAFSLTGMLVSLAIWVLLFPIRLVFKIVFGIVGAVFGAVFGVIGAVFGLVGGLIGGAFGLLGGLMGLIFAPLGLAIAAAAILAAVLGSGAIVPVAIGGAGWLAYRKFRPSIA